MLISDLKRAIRKSSACDIGARAIMHPRTYVIRQRPNLLSGRIRNEMNLKNKRIGFVPMRTYQIRRWISTLIDHGNDRHEEIDAKGVDVEKSKKAHYCQCVTSGQEWNDVCTP